MEGAHCTIPFDRSLLWWTYFSLHRGTAFSAKATHGSSRSSTGQRSTISCRSVRNMTASTDALPCLIRQSHAVWGSDIWLALSALRLKHSMIEWMVHVWLILYLFSSALAVEPPSHNEVAGAKALRLAIKRHLAMQKVDYARLRCAEFNSTKWMYSLVVVERIERNHWTEPWSSAATEHTVSKKYLMELTVQYGHMCWEL